MTDTPTADEKERGYTITRVFDAPRALVWQAWTTPEHFAVWFGGSQARMESVVMDVRPGGLWSGTMVLPDGNTIDWRGNYREVEEPQRLVMAVTDQPAGDEYELYTVVLTEMGDKTQMVLRQSGGHLTDEEYGFAKQGTATFLDAMADLLTRL
jgi:uncharacterized protein YndB with AHSA1/START domain